MTQMPTEIVFRLLSYKRVLYLEACYESMHNHYHQIFPQNNEARSPQSLAAVLKLRVHIHNIIRIGLNIL